jgi:hypothetical protein
VRYRVTTVVPVPSVMIPAKTAREHWHDTDRLLRDGSLSEGFTLWLRASDGRRIAPVFYEPIREQRPTPKEQQMPETPQDRGPAEREALGDRMIREVKEDAEAIRAAAAKAKPGDPV